MLCGLELKYIYIYEYTRIKHFIRRNALQDRHLYHVNRHDGGALWSVNQQQQHPAERRASQTYIAIEVLVASVDMNESARYMCEYIYTRMMMACVMCFMLVR